MIRSFRHRGLRRLFLRGDRKQVRPDQLSRIEDILARLNVAARAEELALPGYRLHSFKGDLQGFWSVTVCLATGGSFFASAMAMRTTWT